MKRLLTAGAVALAFAAQAEVKLASIFGDKMVLQRQTAIRVWGTADAGEPVTVEFAGLTAKTTAGADGAWLVELHPLEACKAGRTLKASGPKNSVECRDVLVGEVWFACGQSNTEMPLCGANPHFFDSYGFLTAQMARNRNIRFARTSNYKWSVSPKREFAEKVEWKEFNRENLAKAPSFSAIGVYYAMELYAALEIPVAIVGSYWGGTRIEPWTPPSGFAQVESCKEEAKYVPQPTTNTLYGICKNMRHLHQQPTVLWNEQVAPWAPFAIKGFIWYQGCSNASEWKRYADMMHALYRGWAKEFRNPGLKLYFVQLAPWGYPGIANIQEAQAKFDAEEPNAGMAVINDVGNLHDIHPNQKYIVGKRLAVHALKRDYGFGDVTDNSPTVSGWEVKDGKVVLRFNDAEGWYFYHPSFSISTGFEIAGADGKFVPAKIENMEVEAKNPNRSRGAIKGKDLILSAAEVKEPKMVRYLHSSPWYGGMYSHAGLPLGAFHLGY